MYMFGTLNRREKRLILILVTANLLITILLYAGTRSFASRSASSESDTTRVASESSTHAPSVATLNPRSN